MSNYAKSTSFSKSIKFREVTDAVAKAVEDNADNYVLEKLNTSFFSGGMAAEDLYRGKRKYKGVTSRILGSWTKKKRYDSGKNSVGWQFISKAKHATFIYTSEPSPYHPSGFRSAYPHEPVKYKGAIVKRPNQITSARYNRFKGTVRKLLLRGIKKSMLKSLNSSRVRKKRKR